MSKVQLGNQIAQCPQSSCILMRCLGLLQSLTKAISESIFWKTLRLTYLTHSCFEMSSITPSVTSFSEPEWDVHAPRHLTKRTHLHLPQCLNGIDLLPNLEPGHYHLLDHIIPSLHPLDIPNLNFTSLTLS